MAISAYFGRGVLEKKQRGRPLRLSYSRGNTVYVIHLANFGSLLHLGVGRCDATKWDVVGKWVE